MKSLMKLSPVYIKMPRPDDPTPSKIRRNPKHFPYFKDCRMAVDGTHLPIAVPSEEADRFRGRKGITQNVLAACSFDLNFTYVMSGWEGAAADGRLMADALQRGYTIHDGEFFKNL
jgi:hypothetical protein